MSPITERSYASAVCRTRHPPSSGPTRWWAGTRTSSRNTSLKCASPVIWRIGRTSTPGWSIGHQKNEMPWCFGTSQFVRATSMPNSASLPPGGPHLLAVDDPLVAVAVGARLQAGEVGAGAGLGVQQAHLHVVDQQAVHELLLELLGPERQHRVRPQVVLVLFGPRRSGASELLGDHLGRLAVEAAAVPLGRPRRHGPAGIDDCLEPLLARQLLPGRPPLVEPGPDLVAQRRLGHRRRPHGAPACQTAAARCQPGTASTAMWRSTKRHAPSTLRSRSS